MRLHTAAVLIASVVAFAACSSSSSSSAGIDAGAPPAPPPPPANPPPPPNAPPPPADAGCTTKTGFESAAPLGAAGGDYGFGHASMVIGASDAPMVAYIAFDPNKDTDPADSELRFVAYDTSACAWRAPIKIDVVGNITSNRPHREVSLARDAATGELAIAYVVSTSATDFAWLARSTDNGATWTKEQVAMTSYSFRNPLVAVGGGKTHYLYWEGNNLSNSGSVPSDSSTFHYVSRSGASGTFADGALVTYTNTNGTRGAEPVPGALALDSANNPAMVFVTHPDSASQTLEVRYWRPSVAPVLVIDSQGTQDDFPAAALVFDGTKPRVATSLQRTASTDGRNIWFVGSDDGMTWGSPVQMPADGGDSMGVFVSIATGGGKTTIASDWIASNGTHTYGGPKLSTSTDLASWATIGADPLVTGDGSLGAAGNYVTVRQASTGKRVLAFVYDGTSSTVAKGIVVWREP